MMDPEKHVRITDFARMMGVSHVAIIQAITDGRIKSVVRSGKRRFLDRKKAKDEYLFGSGRLDPLLFDDESLQTERKCKDTSARELAGKQDEFTQQAISKNRQKISEYENLRLKYATLREKQKYEREAGKLVELSRVQNLVYLKNRQVAQTIRSLIMATVPQLKSMSDEEAIRFQTEKLNVALRNLPQVELEALQVYDG